MNTELVLFYQGQGSDNKGRTLVDILDWDDDKWESVHDFVQWVFPLNEKSAYNPKAPLLDAETIKVFRTDVNIQERIRSVLHRAEEFFEAYGTDAPRWFSPYDHNLLRVTRVLKFLMLVGLEEEAFTFHTWLTDLATKYPDQVPTKTLEFWQKAIES